jgi:hypothetical protein
VKVGTEGREYHLHEQLLVYYSGYFRGALGSSTFKEAEDKVVTLTDITPLAFNGFTAFIYTKSLSPTTIPDWRYRPMSSTMELSCRFIYSYVFADRFIVPEMSKAIMHLTYQELSKRSSGPIMLPHYANIEFAFANLRPEDPYLELLVDSHCAFWSPALDEKRSRDEMDALPKEFLYRVMKRNSELHPGTNRSALREHSYYERGLAKEASATEKE